MLRLRSVASFAIDAHMLARFLRLRDIAMAILAGLMAGISDRTSGNLRQRVAAEMPVLPEAVRNQDGAHYQEDRQCRRKYRCHPEKMFGILELIHGSIPWVLPRSKL